MEITITPRKKRWTGRIAVPGDKSISHRAVILASLAEGDSLIENLLESADTHATISCLQKLGIEIRRTLDGTVVVVGRGLDGWREPEEVLLLAAVAEGRDDELHVVARAAAADPLGVRRNLDNRILTVFSFFEL